jgi:cysteinyl-tRNA synthetase
MPIRLFNTLTRSIDDFEPLAPPRVTFYMCGPTVWNYAHIGNFRTFLFGDLLRRFLEYKGFDVFMVMNLTDVDDRTIKAAHDNHKTLTEHTDPFVKAFFDDRDYLRMRAAHTYPRATEYIESMVALVERLLEAGIAYKSDDGSVYFAVDRFDTYGRLSQVERRELRVGARVASDEYDKEDARDFALWKAAVPADEAVGAAWDAPFGRGRPGWHLECSAMALGEIAHLGVKTLDVHAGGVDLTFPHHENEIAQSEAATGEQFARFWLHGEFLNVKGTKMSKRFGNILTARDLREEGVDAAAIRLLVFSTHYRQTLNFTDEALQGAAEGVRRLGDFARRLRRASSDQAAEAPEEALAYQRDFEAALDDDLNAPGAVAALFTFVRQANKALDSAQWQPGQDAATLEILDRTMEVLDILPTDSTVNQDLREWVEERLAARQDAREARDFGRADEIRGELVARGVEIEDTPSGPRWRLGSG